MNIHLAHPAALWLLIPMLIGVALLFVMYVREVNRSVAMQASDEEDHDA